MARKLMLMAAASVFVFGCGGEQGAIGPAAERVELTTTDGWKIVGDFYPAVPEAQIGKALLLLHMLKYERSTMQPLVTAAVKRGMPCLAIDLRGHGESVMRNGKRLTVGAFLPGKDFLDMEKDVDAAMEYLRTQRSIEPGKVVVVGASIGANLALVYCSHHPEVRGTALLSPGVEYRGMAVLKPAQKYGKRPAFLACSKDDAYAFKSLDEISVHLDEAKIKLRIFDDGGHGTELFDTQPEVIYDMLDWVSGM